MEILLSDRPQTGASSYNRNFLVSFDRTIKSMADLSSTIDNKIVGSSPLVTEFEKVERVGGMEGGRRTSRSGHDGGGWCVDRRPSPLARALLVEFR